MVQESIDEASRREALYKKDAPALVPTFQFLQDMWASLHLHEALAAPTSAENLSQEPPPQLIDKAARTSRLGLDPRSRSLKPRARGPRPCDRRRRPSSAPRRRRPRSARPARATTRVRQGTREAATRPGVEKRIIQRASKNEDKMKVAAFAAVARSPEPHVPEGGAAVLGSLKYSRTAPVDVVVLDHVLDHLQAKNKKWSDERLVHGRHMRPPPQPKKKVEDGRRPRRPSRSERTTSPSPAAEPASSGARRSRRRRSPPGGGGGAPSRPETSREFTDARPQSAPADGRRRRRKKKKKRRKSKKRAGFFSLKADDEDANGRIYDRSRRPSSCRWSKIRCLRRSPASARSRRAVLIKVEATSSCRRASCRAPCT